MKLTLALQIADNPDEYSVEMLENAHYKLTRRSTKLEKIGRQGYRGPADNLNHEIVCRYINRITNRLQDK